MYLSPETMALTKWHASKWEWEKLWFKCFFSVWSWFAEAAAATAAPTLADNVNMAYFISWHGRCFESEKEAKAIRSTYSADNLHSNTKRRKRSAPIIKYYIRFTLYTHLSISLFIQFEITFSYLMIVVFNGWKFVQNRSRCNEYEVRAVTKKKKKSHEKERVSVSVYFFGSNNGVKLPTSLFGNHFV